jgi:hypothetical protein
MYRLARRLAVVGLALVTVVAGWSAAAPAFADETTGTVAGHLTDAGQPYSDALVALITLDWTQFGNVVPDADGAYTFTDVPPGDYKLVISHNMGLQQWYHQKFDFGSADTFTVVAGQETVVDEEVFPHGSLSGTITDSDGNPVFEAHVSLYTGPGGFVTQWSTDENGHYMLPLVLPGTYYVEIGTPVPNSPVQWRGQKRSMEESGPLTVGVGDNVTLDEALLPTATIQGRVTRDGEPVRSAVTAYDAVTGARLSGVKTAASGTYALHVFSGAVKVAFRESSSGPVLFWARNKTTEAEADVFDMAGGDELTIDQDLSTPASPPGTVTGHLSESDGSPAPGALVYAINTSTSAITETTTDSSGNYSVSVDPADYQVKFIFGNGAQYAYGTSGDGDDPAPTVFTVGAGQVVTVDDTLRYATSATMTVTAVDSVTKAPIASFCAGIPIRGVSYVECTEDGSVDLTHLAPGSYDVVVYASGETEYLGTFLDRVPVVAGSNPLTVKLEKGATLEVTVKDAKTGAPVANACPTLTQPDNPSYFAAEGPCTDETGRVSMTMLRPDTYNSFVWANDGVHGHQWVGQHGGVGAMADAKAIKLKAGATVSLTVKLDGRGSITGVVKDSAGVPVAEVGVGTSSRWGDPAGTAGTDESGRFAITDLGPYDWTLLFSAPDVSRQWSGGGGNRFAAELVKVKAGKTTTYNMTLPKPSVLTGTVLFANGQPVANGDSVIAVNALTHDEMAHAGVDHGVYLAPLVGPQDVKLKWVLNYDGNGATGWYKNATDLAHAKVVAVPAHGTKTVNITVPSVI